MTQTFRHGAPPITYATNNTDMNMESTINIIYVASRSPDAVTFIFRNGIPAAFNRYSLWLSN